MISVSMCSPGPGQRIGSGWPLSTRAPGCGVPISSCHFCAPGRAAERRRDYLAMGVGEVWSWTPRVGAAVHVPGSERRPVAAEESTALRGLARQELDRLWSTPDWRERDRLITAIAARLNPIR